MAYDDYFIYSQFKELGYDGFITWLADGIQRQLNFGKSILPDNE